jgi:tetratricopeptide (TPR) repeat protein
MAWAQAERQSAAVYLRLAREAGWHEEGAAGLWGDPELELGLRWRETNRPTAAWAERYDPSFDRAVAFLDRSERERARQRADRRAARIRRLVIAWGTAAVLLVMTAVLLVLLVVANRERRAANTERARAEQNLRIAADAVDKLLVSIDRDPTTIGADIPAMQELRRELLERAKPFYDQFLRQNAGDEVLSGMAEAHLRLGHINRMLNDTKASLAEYERAITAFQGLAERNRSEPAYRRGLASAHNWLGETLRLSPDTFTAADAAYEHALELQTALVRGAPDNIVYQQELARTRNNRGILYDLTANPGDAGFVRAEADFREAIRLLEPLATPEAAPQVSEDLGRSVNNLASLIARDPNRLTESRHLYERAIDLHEQLITRQPDNRQYRLELAKFSNNLAEQLRVAGDVQGAGDRNRRAQELLDELARPAPTLGVERADAHTLRGHILQPLAPAAAVAEYRSALIAFEDLARAGDIAPMRDFHLRFGDLLANLGALTRERPELDSAERLLSDAASSYLSLGERAFAAGLTAPAATVVETLSDISTSFADRDRRRVAALSEDLARKVRAGTTGGS